MATGTKTDKAEEIRDTTGGTPVPQQERALQETRGLMACEVRGIDEAARTATFVGATETGVETYWGKEYLRMSGGDFARYRKNPVILDSHDTSTAAAVIGRGQATVRGREVLVEVTFAETERAETIWQLVQGGFVRAMSIRFMPRAVKVLGEGEYDGRGEARIEGPARIVTDWEALEFSPVGLGADPEALRRAITSELLSDAAAEVTRAVRALQDATRELSMPKEKTGAAAAGDAAETETTSQTEERTADTAGARADTGGTPVPQVPTDPEARKLAALREQIVALAPTGLRTFAEGLAIQDGMTLAEARKQLLAKHAEGLTPSGTPEPPKPAGKEQPRAVEHTAETTARFLTGL